MVPADHTMPTTGRKDAPRPKSRRRCLSNYVSVINGRDTRAVLKTKTPCCAGWNSHARRGLEKIVSPRATAIWEEVLVGLELYVWGRYRKVRIHWLDGIG